MIHENWILRLPRIVMLWKNRNGSRGFSIYIRFIRLRIIFGILTWSHSTRSSFPFTCNLLLRWLWKCHIARRLIWYRCLLPVMHILNSTWRKFLLKWCHFSTEIHGRLLITLGSKYHYVLVLLLWISSLMCNKALLEVHWVHFDIVGLHLGNAVLGWESSRLCRHSLYLLPALIRNNSTCSTFHIVQTVC